VPGQHWRQPRARTRRTTGRAGVLPFRRQM